MNNNPAVSVIVPMYNVEEYLPKCVGSLLSQTLDNIEVILVDDESPDGCGALAEAYAKKDPRVKVVHRKNGGLGPARNSGLEVATGDYVGFVDSDDWVERDMYERLYEAAMNHGAQIVFSELKRVAHGMPMGWSSHPFCGVTLRGDDEIYQLRRSLYGPLPNRLKDDPIPVSVCPNIYRRSLIEENGIKFRAIRSEDILFNAAVCRVASCVAAIDGAPYCYRKDDQESITNTFKASTIESFFVFFDALQSECQKESSNHFQECEMRVHRRVIDYSRGILVKIASSNLDYKEKRECARTVLNSPYLLSACRAFPFWLVPPAQAVFFIVMRFRFVDAALLLASGRNSFGGN